MIFTYFKVFITNVLLYQENNCIFVIERFQNELITNEAEISELKLLGDLSDLERLQRTSEGHLRFFVIIINQFVDRIRRIFQFFHIGRTTLGKQNDKPKKKRLN